MLCPLTGSMPQVIDRSEWGAAFDSSQGLPSTEPSRHVWLGPEAKMVAGEDSEHGHRQGDTGDYHDVFEAPEAQAGWTLAELREELHRRHVTTGNLPLGPPEPPQEGSPM